MFLMRNHRRADARRALRAFSVAALFNDLGSDSVRPFWPVFVTSVLGAPVALLGMLDGMGELVSYGSRFPSGWLSDRIRRRKPLVWLGYMLAGFARIGYALSPSASWLFPFKAMDRLGKLRDPPRDALLADVTPQKQRGLAFGFLASMDNIGATLGPILGIVLFAMLGYRGLFAAAAIPSIIGAVGIMWLVHEHRPKPLRIKKRALGKRFRTLTLLSAMFALGWVSVSFMVLHATSREGVPLIMSPALFIVMSLLASLASRWMGRVSDRIGRRLALIASYALYPLVAAGFALAHMAELSGTSGIVMSVALFAAYGAHYGSMTAIQPAYVTETVPSASRAYASGLFQSLFGISAFAASIIGGLLWDVISPAAAFGYGFLVSLASLLIMAVWLE